MNKNADPWNLDERLGDLALIDVKTGNVKRITSHSRVAASCISPDGSRIAYSVPVQFERPGSQQILHNLLVFDRQTGQIRKLQDRIRLGLNGKPIEWLKDGTRLVYRSHGALGTGEISIVDIRTGRVRVVSLPSESARPRSDETELMWDASGKRAYFLQAGELWSVNLTNDRAEKLSSIPNHSLTQIAKANNQFWQLDGGVSTVVITNDESLKQSGFYRVDLDSGQSKRLLESNSAITSATVSPDGSRLAYVEEDAQHPPDLWITDANFTNRRRLTHINVALDRYTMGQGRLIEWQTADGKRLRGALLLPSNYREGQKYPLVVYVYAGSLLSDSINTFGFNGLVGMGTMQLLASRGYAVLFPDCPISPASAMADVLKTVNPGVDRVVEMGVADPNSIGVMGHSHGGFSVLSLITQSTRFKAAVMGDGLGDWMSAYGAMSSDGGAFLTSVAESPRALGGTPWEYRNRYIENSPIFYFDRVQTPLLIFHGSEDRAVPVHLGDEVFVDLRRLGKTVQYASYIGEDHSPAYWKHSNQIDLLERIIGWFDRYLKGA